MAQQIASLYAKIGADTKGLDKGLGSTKSKLKTIGGNIAKYVGPAAIGAALVGAGKKAADVAGDFESQMNTLAIAARSSGTGLDDLQDAAIATGADTRLVGISAAESASAMEDLYKAGLSTSDIFGDLNAYMNDGAELGGVLRAAIDLAAASELELGDASDAVSIAMATFGKNAGDVRGITDNFVRTADASVASVGDLTSAMVNVGPTAAAFGWEMEDVNTALGILSQRGIKGSEAGTALKSMMTNLMRPTDDVTETLDTLGVSLYDAEGQMRSLPDIIGQLESGMSGLSEEQKNTAVQTLAGTYGMKAMNTLLGEGTEGWEDMEDAVANAASAQEVADAKTQGFNSAMENLGGVIETFMIKVGTPLIQKVLTPIVEKLTAGVEWLMNFGDNWGGVNDTIGGVLSGPMAKIAPFVQEIRQIWERAWTKVQEIAKQVWNDVGPFVLEMVGKVTAFFREKFQDIISWFVVNLPLIKRVVDKVLDGIQAVWTTVWPEIRDYVIMVWEVMKRYIEIAITTVQGVIKAVMQAIDGDWEGAWTTIKETARTVWEKLKEIVAIAIDYLKEKISVIWTKVQPALAQAWDAIQTKAGEIWDALSTKAEEVWTSIKDYIKDNIETARDKAAEFWDSVKTKAEEVWTAVTTAVETAVDSVVTAVTSIPTKLGELVTEF